MLPARTVNGATRVFYGPREHPNVFQGTGQHWLIFQENKGINLIFGDRKVAIWKTHPFLCIGIHIRYCPSAIAVFRCFVNIQKDADERKLTQAGRTNIAIYAPNLRYVCVRRYQQFCTLMANGDANNQNSLIAVTQWVEKTDLIRTAVWSYSTMHAEKVRLALATPLWKQLSPFIAETPHGPRGSFDCLS